MEGRLGRLLGRIDRRNAPDLSHLSPPEQRLESHIPGGLERMRQGRQDLIEGRGVVLDLIPPEDSGKGFDSGNGTRLATGISREDSGSGGVDEATNAWDKYARLIPGLRDKLTESWTNHDAGKGVEQRRP